jgi:hypothetical protein
MKVESLKNYSSNLPERAIGLQPSEIQTQNKNLDYIPFGLRNLFPQIVSNLNRQAATNRAILNNKQLYAAGEGLEAEDDRLNENLKENKLWDKSSNGIYDYFSQGNSYIVVLTDRNGSFLQFRHIDVTTVRIKKDKSGIIIHPEWKNYETSKQLAVDLPFYPNFDKVKDTKGVIGAAIHIRSYEQEFSNYGIPSYYAALEQILLQQFGDKRNLNQVENMTQIQGLLVLSGIESVEEATSIEEDLEGSYGLRGDKAGSTKLIAQKDTQVGESRTPPVILDLQKPLDGDWIQLDDKSKNKLIEIHSWYNVLMGQSTPGQLGGNQQILNTYELAKKTVIDPTQKLFLDSYTKIYKDFGFDTEGFRFINTPPITEVEIEVELWQLLKMKGFEFDQNIHTKLIKIPLETFLNIQNGSNNIEIGGN